MAARRFKLLYIAPPPLDLDAFPRRVGKLVGNVANAYGLHGSTLEDLQSAGYVRALELSKQFRPAYPEGYRQPDNAFWGWAYREVLTEIQREAARLRAGGTIRSPRRVPGAPVVIARPISDLEDDDGEVNLATVTVKQDAEDESAAAAKPRKAASAAGEQLLKAGAAFGQFLSIAERLAGVDFAMSADVEQGGASIRYSFCDGRSNHFFRIHSDGTLEHRAAALPVGARASAPRAAERN